MSNRNVRLVLEAIESLTKEGNRSPTNNQIYTYLTIQRNQIRKEEIISALNRANMDGLLETRHVVTSNGFARNIHVSKKE